MGGRVRGRAGIDTGRRGLEAVVTERNEFRIDRDVRWMIMGSQIIYGIVPNIIILQSGVSKARAYSYVIVCYYTVAYRIWAICYP